MQRNLVVIFIDPVFDFVNEAGIYQKKFGSDAQPLIDVLPVLELILHRCTSNPHLTAILCTSKYRYNQFNTEGLEKLCTEDYGQTSCLEESAFDLHVTKNTNNLFDVPETESAKLNVILEHGSDVMIVGMTTTSCIKAAVTELLHRRIQIIVPRDAIAHRISSNKVAEELLNQWSNNGVHIISNWEQALNNRAI
jgi:nicotinamidase-related amidase